MKKIYWLVVALLLLNQVNVVAQMKVSCIINDTVAFHLQNARGSIQWQSSLDSLVWNNELGEVNEHLDFNASMERQWIRALVSEAGCPPFIEGPYLISAVDTSALGYHSNVVVMDTVLVDFVSDSLQQEAGIYQYTTQADSLPLQPGDIIIGTDGYGYLRFIDSFVLQDGVLTMQTHQAVLDDLFDDASFAFDVVLDSMQQRDLGIQLNIGQIPIFSYQGTEFRLESGSVGIGGDLHADYDFSLFGGLENFALTSNLSVSSDLVFGLNTAAGSISIPTYLDVPIGVYVVPFAFQAGPFPLLGVVRAELAITLSAEGEVSPHYYTAHATASSGMDMSLNYDGSSWSTSSSAISNSSDLTFQGESGTDSFGWKAGLAVKITPVFYGAITSGFVQGGVYMQSTTTNSIVTNDWDRKEEIFGEISAGIDLNVPFISLDVPVAELSLWRSDPWHTYKAPTKIQLVSGDNQYSDANYNLPEEIMVIVKDTLGVPVPNVPVHAEVTLGGGSVVEAEVNTDADGLARFVWHLAAGAPNHELRLHVRTANLNDISGSPIVVHATVPGSLALSYSGYVQSDQAVWNTPSTTLHATGGVPPYEYNFFENCATWTTDSIIQYPADGIVVDECININFLYGGFYTMRVRDATGAIASTSVYIDRERAYVNTTSTNCSSFGGGFRYLAFVDISSPDACFNLQSNNLIFVHNIEANIPGLSYAGGLGGALGTGNDWNMIVNGVNVSTGQPDGGALVPGSGINAICTNNYSTYIRFDSDSGATSCPGGSCSYRARFTAPNGRWIWSNVITHNW
jgi:hypothetical protein